VQSLFKEKEKMTDIEALSDLKGVLAPLPVSKKQRTQVYKSKK
jgi:hypothetical protein